MRRDVFQAIADPQRRAIISLVAGKALNLNAIAGNFGISRPAISRHIRILTQCGLLTIREDGRERICTARLAPLREVNEWTEHYRRFWSEKLDALGSFLEQAPAAPKRKLTKKQKRK